MVQHVENRIKSRIIGKKRGWVFTAASFTELGSYDSIRKALAHLTTTKFIQRISWGIYYYPIIDKRFGTIPPDLNLVAQTIAEKDKIRLQPSGAHAANLIGLSEQVAAKMVFLTDGMSKKIKIGNRSLIFKKVSPKTMTGAGGPARLLIQALRHLGQKQLDDAQMRGRLKRYLERWGQKDIATISTLAPRWITVLIKEIMEQING